MKSDGELKGEMMEEKICPLFRTKKDIQKCLKEVCAWWGAHYNCCAVLSAAILFEVLTKKEKAQTGIKK